MKEDIDDTITILVAEAIEVHCGEIHAHQRMDAARVVGLQEIAMGRSKSAEPPFSQVEKHITPLAIKVPLAPWREVRGEA